MKPRLEIRYCTQCGWLLRSAWLAQEVLGTFANELGEVALVPGDVAQFQITVGATMLWERKRDGGFPDAAELKRRIRDAIAPDRTLGHVDG